MIFAVFFVLIMSGIFSARLAYAGTLSCSVTTAAACTGTVILRMSGNGNAHAELPSQANGNYDSNVVCCTGVTGLGNSCAGTFAVVGKLSGSSNAHIEDKSLSNYANSACISVSSGSVSTGTTTSTCVGAGYDTTIASMSNNTNAHAGDGSAYSTKICATATTGSNPPTLTTYTNSTETGLNYATSCAGCGARIGGGAGFRQTVVITGTNFGADPGAGNRSSASNNVKVGAQQIASANVTAWSDTSITFLTDSNVSGDADSDWGADFGGASALTVTAGGSASGGLNFYIFPQVTSLTVCDKAGFPVADNAREYDVTDSACPNGLKDGQIKLNGTRFGTASTGGYVRVLGCDSSTCSSPTGTVNIDSWSNTLIQSQIPTIIANNSYTGSLAIQQGTGSNNKTHTYTSTGFRVLPRITGFTPSSDSEGAAVTIDGDHFCQNNGSCPTVFGANDKVTFYNAKDATTFTSWTNTAMSTAVPTGAATGDVVLKSNTYNSNGKSFTVLSNIPVNPASLNQYKNSGLTQAISVGGTASATPIYLKQTMEVTGISGGTLYPQFEYKLTGVAFVCGAGVCGSATEGIGWAGPGPTTGTTSISVADGDYHWQARARHYKNSVNYYSNWVSFGENADPGDMDFKMDTVGPTITNISSGAPGSNSATITWDTTGELSTSQVQYNTTGTFVDNCATNNDCATLTDTPPETNGKMANHSVSLSNLSSGTTYYYRVRSKGADGNETISSNNTFATQSVTQPGKTTRFHISGFTTKIDPSTASTTTFTIDMPENSTSIKSAYIEITGISDAGNSDPNGINVQFNSEASVHYVAPTGNVFVADLKIIHKINSVNVSPSTNTLTITTDTYTNFYISSANIYVTYGYTP